MWSPAECKHCGYEILPAKHAASMGWAHEPAPTGWVHNQDMVELDHWDNNVANPRRIREHSAHPKDNRSTELEEHGAAEVMRVHDLGSAVSDVLRPHLGDQFK